MNSDEARTILLACRPGTADEHDPDVRAALAAVQRDPQLAAWWREQQAVQAALRDRLRELPVPPELRARLLAGPTVITVPWWRLTRVRALAIAAALVALLALVFVRPPSPEPESFADFRERMVRTVIREYRMDVTTPVEAEVRAFLRANQGHGDYRLPPAMRDVPVFGAGRLTWKGRPVSMICFARRPGVLMYLFVADRTVFPDGPAAGPDFAEVVQRATASWTDAGQVYVLASEAGAADLRSLLP